MHVDSSTAEAPQLLVRRLLAILGDANEPHFLFMQQVNVTTRSYKAKGLPSNDFTKIQLHWTNRFHPAQNFGKALM